MNIDETFSVINFHLAAGLVVRNGSSVQVIQESLVHDVEYGAFLI